MPRFIHLWHGRAMESEPSMKCPCVVPHTIVACEMCFLAMKARPVSFLLLWTISRLARGCSRLYNRLVWSLYMLALCRGERLFLEGGGRRRASHVSRIDISGGGFGGGRGRINCCGHGDEEKEKGRSRGKVIYATACPAGRKRERTETKSGECQFLDLSPSHLLRFLLRFRLSVHRSLPRHPGI